MNLFTYGSLMFPEVWTRLVGPPGRCERSRLRGYATRRKRDDVFPGLITADPQAVVSGIVYFDLSDGVLKRLDEFETDFYRRMSVTVELTNGQPIPAEVYVVAGDRFDALGDEPWDAEVFRRDHLEGFLQNYRGWKPAAPSRDR